MKLTILAATSGLALSAFLIAAPVSAQNSYPTPSGDRVDASGQPTTHSTPDEQAQTAGLNGQVSSNNAQADAQSDANNAQYQAQQQQYQSQLQQNNAAQAQYQDQTAAYETLRGRYAAERRAYHRDVWPDSYDHWRIVRNDRRLLDSKVKRVGGAQIGDVNGVARGTDGHIEALRVTLEDGKTVWIDEADLRFDIDSRTVYTDLASNDLSAMADERM